MCRQSKDETHVARKTHKCSWCWQAIHTGDTYIKYRFYDSGDALTVRSHLECRKAIDDYIADNGGVCVEWTPGMDRPRVDDERVMQ